MAQNPFSKSTNGGFKQEPPGTRMADGKIYAGIVKNNRDVQNMGRLEVWIPEMGGNPDDSSKWIICSYASPFAGATNVKDNKQDSQHMNNSQITYGMWFVPPDLENQVLVLFLGGETTRAFWFACVWQQNMNHMVPGVASNFAFEQGESKVLPPVVEYNKKTSNPSFNPDDPVRPRFNPLHEGLKQEGLYTDFERGPASTSARREAPSMVFGTITPRSNTIHFDDDPKNEFIRMRTRGGTQILIHETNGYVYINSKKGNSWLEVSDSGVDVYSKGNISLRTEQDFNVRADRDINMDAGRDVNIKARRYMKLKSGNDMHLKTDTNYFCTAQFKHQSRSETMRQSAQTHDTRARYINRDGLTFDNYDRSKAAEFAKAPDLVDHRDVNYDIIPSPVSRMPTHEPWPGHPKSSVTTPPAGDLPGVGKTITGDGTLQNNSGGPADPNNQTTQTPTRDQQRGTGPVEKIPVDRSSIPDVKVGTKNVPKDVNAAIAKGASTTGVDYGYMMAMAEQESGFNPNAKAKTSSASGLYQFTDGTWNAMVNKYGAQHGITKDMKNDPEAQAIMAGYYAKENKAVIEKRTGKPANATDLYLGHFLGGNGAANFLSADKNADASTVVGSKAANANPSIFKNKDGSNRTVQEVRDLFAKKIEPKANAYNAAKPPAA